MSETETKLSELQREWERTTWAAVEARTARKDGVLIPWHEFMQALQCADEAWDAYRTALLALAEPATPARESFEASLREVQL